MSGHSNNSLHHSPSDTPTGARPAGWLSRLFGRRGADPRTTQSFRRLAMQLEFELGRLERGRVLLMTPVGPAKDASHAAIELARVLAGELGKRTLVIDGAFSAGAVSVATGLESREGLVELLRREGIAARYDESIDRGFAVLARGRDAELRPPPIVAVEVRQIIEDARSTYEYVLIATDSPREDGRCLVFPALADRVLLLVTEGRTLLEDVDVSRNALERCSETRVGLVLTQPRRVLGLL